MRFTKSSEQFAFHSVGSSSGLAISNLSPLSHVPGPEASVQLIVFQKEFETLYRIPPIFLVRKLRDVFRTVDFVLAAVAFLFLKGAVLRLNAFEFMLRFCSGVSSSGRKGCPSF